MGLLGDLFGAVAKGAASRLVEGIINEEVNKDPIASLAVKYKVKESKYKCFSNEKLIDIAYNAEDDSDRALARYILNSRGYVMTSWKVKISGDLSIGPNKVKEVEVVEVDKVREKNKLRYKIFAHDKAKAIEIANEKIVPEIASKRPELKNIRVTSAINTEWIASVRGYAKNKSGHSDVFDINVFRDNEDDARSIVISRAESRHKKYENFKIESIHRVIEE